MTTLAGSSASVPVDDMFIYTWGSNANRQLGDPTVTAAASWSDIAISESSGNGTGLTHKLAIKSDGTLWAWGSNGIAANNPLGLGAMASNTTYSEPVQVGTATNWVKVAANYSSSYAINSLGELYVWGSNTTGALGVDNATYTGFDEPTKLGSDSWTAISADRSSMVAIKSDGTLWGCGRNLEYQLGTGNNSDVTGGLTQIGNSTTWTDINMGSSHAAGINSNKLYMWGRDNDQTGALGILSPANSWKQVSIGNSHVAAIKSDGTLWTWGSNSNGELGQGNLTNNSVPTVVDASDWSKVSTPQDSTGATFAIKTDGTLWFTGQASWNPTGAGVGYSTLTQIGTDTGWTSFSPGGPSVGALGVGIRNGRVYGFAQSGITQAIVGGGLVTWTGLTELNAKQLSPGTSWQAASTGSVNTVVLRSDGKLFGAGSSSGGLGLLPIAKKSWVAVNGGQSHTTAIDSSGAIYQWGNSQYLGLDRTSTGNVSYPALVDATYSWTQLAHSQRTTLVLRSDGQLWGWGLNSSQVLPSPGSLNSPILVDSSSWTSIAAGLNAAAGIKLDGTLWTWGANTSQGILGNGTATTANSVPTQLGTDTWSKISVSASHMAAIRSDGTLWAWGANANGQLGQNNVTTRSSPVQIGTSSWTAVSTGSYHTVAIGLDGTLWAWGRNNLGQLGDGSIIDRSSPVQIGTDTNWVKVRASARHNSTSNTEGSQGTMAIKSDGTLWAWGNYYSAVSNASSPVQIGTDTDWSELMSGNSDYMMAIKTNGELWAIGGVNTQGQLGLTGISPVTEDLKQYLGNGDTTYQNPGARPYITDLMPDKTFLSISVGTRYTLAIDNLYQLWAWGNNADGQLGDGTQIDRYSPVQIGAGLSFVAVSAGINHSLGVTHDGNLYAWGRNEFGEGFNDTIGILSVPVQIGTDTDWSSNIRAGLSFSVALKSGASGGLMYVAGNNSLGRLGILDGTNGRSSPTVVGNNLISTVSVPTQLGTDNWSKISVGNKYTLGIKSDNTLWAWGRNDYGQLGLGDVTNRSIPVQVGTSSWTIVDAGINDTSLAIKSGGTLWGWGKNNENNLAIDGDINNYSSPIQIGSKTWSKIKHGNSGDWILGIDSTNKLYQSRSDYNTWTPSGLIATGFGPIPYNSKPGRLGTESWSMVSSGESHIMAIRSDNTLWGWGANNNYQLGLGDTDTRSSPTQIGTGSWTLVSAGGEHTIAVDSIGNMYAWGKNDVGQVGGPGLAASWNVVGRAAYGTHAITTTGELYAWGSLYSSAGSLFGDGSTSGSASVPVQIGVGSTWSKVYNRGGHTTLAIKTDGTLWAWGRNNAGQLGQGDTTNRPSMVQVGSDTNWKDVIIGGNELATSLYVLAVKTNGTLWAWGYNATNGMLGVGDTVSRSSPTQVGALTDWDKVAADATNHSMAIKTDGSLWSWGFFGNASGRTGPVRASSPVQISADSWRTVVGGENWFAGVKTDNTLWLWGDASPLMNSVGGNTSVITQLGTDTNWSTVTALRNGIHALKTDGTLWAWGSSNGLGTALLEGAGLSSPVQIASGISKLANPYPGSNSDHANYITTGGALYQWSNTTNGTFIGDGSAATNSSPVVVTAQGSTQEAVYISPVAVSGATGSWTSVSAGASHNAAIKSTGSLWTWGNNSNGELGLGDTTNRSSPVQVGTSSWTAVSAGGFHTLGIKANGELQSWGKNNVGQVAPPLTKASWQAVSNQLYGAIGIADGKLYTWGASYNDARAVDSYSPPLQLGSATNWNKIYSFQYSAWAIKTDGTLWSWGRNSYGQLGLGDTTNRPSGPVQVGTDTDWVSINGGNAWPGATTNALVFAIKTNGTAWVAGGALYGAGGRADSNYTTFTQMGADTDWEHITVTGVQGISIGLKTDGRLFSWGRSHAAQGTTTLATRSSPVQIGTDTDWNIISTGAEFVAAIKNNGTLWLWGVNPPGPNQGASLSVPTQLGTDTDWVDISAMWKGIYATKAAGDGTYDLYAWGIQEGTGNISLQGGAGSSTPVLIQTGVTGIPSKSSTNLRAGRVIKTGGLLYQWTTSYYNVGLTQTSGQYWLSGGTWEMALTGAPATATSAPAAVYGAPTGSWIAVSAGYDHSHAIYSDYRLYGWGSNAYSQMATPTDKTLRSSAVLVGSNSYSQVSAGKYYTVAVRYPQETRYSWGRNNNGQLGIGWYNGGTSYTDGIYDDKVVEIGPLSTNDGESWAMIDAGGIQAVGIIK